MAASARPRPSVFRCSEASEALSAASAASRKLVAELPSPPLPSARHAVMEHLSVADISIYFVSPRFARLHALSRPAGLLPGGPPGDGRGVGRGRGREGLAPASHPQDSTHNKLASTCDPEIHKTSGDGG